MALKIELEKEIFSLRNKKSSWLCVLWKEGCEWVTHAHGLDTWVKHRRTHEMIELRLGSKENQKRENC